MRILIWSPAVLLLGCLLINGCSPLQGQFKTPEESVSAQPDPVTQARARVEAALRQDQLSIAQAELLKARQTGVAESALQEEFAAVAARLLKEAKVAAEAQSFDLSGKHYRMVMDVYPQTAKVAALMDVSRDEVNAKLDMCADELMKRGLMSYRKGNLLAAVQVWKKIALFMPEHSPSAVAIETAEQQIANLEKLTPAQDH